MGSKNIIFNLCASFGLVLGAAGVALAQTAIPSQTVQIFNQPAGGADMWTGAMGQMFVPHDNNCASSTEAFIPVLSSTSGLCMEINERPAQEWENARHTCLTAGKRLPEIGEFQFGCNSASTFGLIDMTNNEEWGSNFALPFYPPWNNYGMSAPLVGNGSCNYAGTGVIGDIYSSSISRNFRCVH